MHGILFSCLGWCSYLLLGIVRLATKADVQDCRSFTLYLSWTLASSSKCGQVYRYYFGRCSSELVPLVPLPYSQGRSTRYSNRLHDFSVTISRCYKDVYVNSFFPRTASLWNSLHLKCLPLTYDLNGFKFRIKKHLLTVGSFWRYFLHAFCASFSCNSMPCRGCSATNITKNKPSLSLTSPSFAVISSRSVKKKIRKTFSIVFVHVVN